MLETHGLTKEFGNIRAVDDVDLEVRRGEVHGLVGPNGAGKTTMFNLLTGELRPTSGGVDFEGTELTGLSPHEIVREGIGRSFQIVQYFPEMTVREHLHLAVRDETRALASVFEAGDTDEEIQQLASRVRLEDQLDTEVKNLSHGEKRYLDIGMVLGLQPDLLLLDEPAAGLNSSESEHLEAIIDDLRDEYTIFLIEHDIDLVRRLSDRITVLHQGGVLASGTPEEVSENTDVQEVYLGE